MRSTLAFVVAALLASACGKQPSDQHEVETVKEPSRSPTPDTEASGADRAGSTAAARASDNPQAGPGGGGGPRHDAGPGGDAGVRDGGK